MDWTPNVDGLKQLVHLLSQTQVASQEVQSQIYRKLEEFHKIADYNNYLTYIFVKLENTPQNVSTRISAGLLLKNNIMQYYEQFGDNVKQFIQQQVLSCLGDQTDSIRTTAGAIIASIIRRGTLSNWPGLLENLVGGLTNTSTDPKFIDGILCALKMICEDCANEICDAKDERGGEKYAPVLNVLLPTLINYLSHEVPQFRCHALKCLNQFIMFMPMAFKTNFPDFLTRVFTLASDPSPRTRISVCSTFLHLGARLELILPNFDQIVPMMLHFTKDEDDEISLEACEFWNVVCEHPASKDILRPHLPALVPVLLEGMVYSEDDQFLLQSEQQDSSIPDQEQDLEPIHYKSAKGNDDEEDEEDDLDYSEWNLRKCSAAALDYLSEIYHNELLAILIPLIQQKMQTATDWAVAESIILALGAIAKGCYRGMCQYLPDLMPFLFAQMKNPEVLVRSITCWSISRYSLWITNQEHKLYLEPLLAALCSQMLDRNKSVQQAACTAITHLQESTRINLIAYAQPIVETFIKASALYQKKNRFILYDAIGIFCVATIKHSNEQVKNSFTAAVVPSLIQHWNECQDDDKAICNLTECLIDVFGTGDLSLQTFAKVVFDRCLRIIDTNLVLFAANTGHQDSDLILPPLNLLSVMSDLFKNRIEELVGPSNLFGLIFRCLKENSRIRQEAFALLGDLCPYCMPHIAPVLNVYIPEIIGSIAPHPGRSTGNACWALGMIMRYSSNEAIAPFARQIYEAFKFILSCERVSREVLENCGISMGWLAHRNPAIVAQDLGNFFQVWCFALMDIVESDEKTFAYFGFCNAVKANPGSIFNQNLRYLFEAIACWEEPCKELAQEFHLLLQEFKKSAPPTEWAEFMKGIHPQIYEKLSKLYNI